MRDRIYYKNSLGEIYSVSPRIIGLGVPPLGGFVEMSEEEKTSYLEDLSLKRPELFREESLVGEEIKKTPVENAEKQARREAALKRREDRVSRRSERKAAQIAEEHLDFFDNLPEEEISYYENLLNQGLSLTQLFNIKTAKDAKNNRKEV